VKPKRLLLKKLLPSNFPMMKSLKRKDFIIAGVVAKTHGTHGELRLDLEQRILLKEWVFLEIHEKPVPFFIQSLSSGNTDQPVVRLEGIGTASEASRLVNSAILCPAKQSKKRTRAADMDISGFLLVDEVHGELGAVENVEELPKQLLIRTTYRGKELLIPAVEEFIEEIDPERKIVYVHLPDGILRL
jgi:16S rRNA processing protein RimM